MALRNWLRGSRIANAHKAITKSDTEDSTTELPSSTVGLWVGTGGNVNAEMWGDATEVVYIAVVGGSYLEGNFRFIKSTSTTASDFVAAYVV